MKVWDELTFDEVQNVFHKWMSHVARVLENGESTLLSQYEMVSSHVVNLKIGGGQKLSLPLYSGDAEICVPPTEFSEVLYLITSYTNILRHMGVSVQANG
jgi:hypothetical protein